MRRSDIAPESKPQQMRFDDDGVRRRFRGVIEISEALPTDIEQLVELESRLFHEDAAVHDPFSDPTWPEREGREDFTRLLESDDCIVLVAYMSNDIVGFLAGYAVASSPTRQPVEYAVLRSMYVAADARRQGAGELLTKRFLGWARARGCAEAHVDHYIANAGAATLYERCGFAERSVARALQL